MDSDRRLSLIVGGFVLLSVGALALTIVTLSSQQGLWKPRYRLVAYFDNVQGLITGAPVWLAGTQVGRVEELELARRGDKAGVKVLLRVESSVQGLIRDDSVAQIGTIGLLGDKYVELSMGSEESEVLQNGADIAAVSPIDLNSVMADGAAALSNVSDLATNVNEVISKFGVEGAENVTDSFEALGDMIRAVRDGDGLLSSLIYDEYEGSGVGSMESALANLDEIMEEVAHGEGVLHSLIYDAPTEQDVILEALEAGSRLNSILAKVDRGEGTVGLLLNDPTLYEELKLLIGGANRSMIVRAMVRMATDDE